MALILLPPVLSSQSAVKKSWLEAIPESSRERLLKRLNLYIEYERKREYKKLYDLFSDSTIKDFNQENSIVKTKDDYIKWRQTSYPMLVKFKPFSAVYNETLDAYAIYGQATLRWKDSMGKKEALLYAFLKNDEWYFSLLLERIDD